ncbi:MAG: CoA pyrophosphatase [Candidatus Hydrogenedentes bacterium]|nr:CoA pyrophosphatase [Candidatus Hydrogenedentota bacterium]
MNLDTIQTILRQHVPDTAPSARTRHHAAVALVLFPGSDRALSTLFIKRAEHPLDPWSGHMALPGGWKDPTDTTLEAAARRETAEETGVPIAQEALLGRLDDVETDRLRQIDLSVASFVYYLEELPPLTPNREVSLILQAPLDALLDPQRHAVYHFPPDPLHRAWPCIHYDGQIIWGLTYRVLQNFFLLTGDKLPAENELP